MHGDTLENRGIARRNSHRDQIREKLKKMQMGSSGTHLLDCGILQKLVDIQRAWMRSVMAEEKKERIRQKNKAHRDFKKWRIESQRTAAPRGSKDNHRTQSTLDAFLTTNLSGDKKGQLNLTTSDQASRLVTQICCDQETSSTMTLTR